MMCSYQDLQTMLVVCEREVGGRAAMQCDRLVMVLPGSLYFCRLQTTLLHIDFAHTPSNHALTFYSICINITETIFHTGVNAVGKEIC